MLIVKTIFSILSFSFRSYNVFNMETLQHKVGAMFTVFRNFRFWGCPCPFPYSFWSCSTRKTDRFTEFQAASRNRSRPTTVTYSDFQPVWTGAVLAAVWRCRIRGIQPFPPTHIWALLTILGIGFCHTGSISLCIDLFVFICLCVFYVFSTAYMLYSIVSTEGGPDGIEA